MPAPQVPDPPGRGPARQPDGLYRDAAATLDPDLGHDEPTILLTNDLTSTLRRSITRYAQRMLIENGLADSVDFFHLDALSSAVALNVDFDVLLTIIGSGIYRLFAKPLRGYERARARQLFRRFLDTTARVTISEAEVTVRSPRRSHNPILLDAGLIGPAVAIPWWQGRRLAHRDRLIARLAPLKPPALSDILV